MGRSSRPAGADRDRRNRVRSHGLSVPGGIALEDLRRFTVARNFPAPATSSARCTGWASCRPIRFAHAGQKWPAFLLSVRRVSFAAAPLSARGLRSNPAVPTSKAGLFGPRLLCRLAEPCSTHSPSAFGLRSKSRLDANQERQGLQPVALLLQRVVTIVPTSRRVSGIRTPAKVPDAIVNSPMAPMAARIPNVSARTPAIRAPATYPESRQNR